MLKYIDEYKYINCIDYKKNNYEKFCFTFCISKLLIQYILTINNDDHIRVLADIIVEYAKTSSLHRIVSCIMYV